MTTHKPNGQLTRIRKRVVALSVVAFSITTFSAQAQDVGHVEGTLIANGEQVDLKYAYVFTEDHPFNAGESGFVIKLTTEEVAVRELDSAFAGGSTVSVKFDAQGEVYSRDVFLRTSTGSMSASGLDFEFNLQQSGPEEYRGSMLGTVEFFDDRYEFSLTFAAAPQAETGTPLPADGGEPGRAYLAHFELMGSGDWDKIRQEIPEDELEGIKQLGLSDEEVLEFLTLFRPSEVEIVGGTLDGDTAYLDVKMVMDGEPGTGTITMEKQDDKWVLASEAWGQ